MFKTKNPLSLNFPVELIFLVLSSIIGYKSFRLVSDRNKEPNPRKIPVVIL